MGMASGCLRLGFHIRAWVGLRNTSEILTTETRDLAMGLSGFSNSAISFAIGKLFPLMLNSMKPYGTFWFFAGVSLFGVAFPPLFMLETRGKTLEEIQRHYARNLKRTPTSSIN